MKGIYLSLFLSVHSGFAEPLAGTQPLDWEGDIASRLIDSADAFLLKKIEQSMAAEKAELPDRAELARILGVVDKRVAPKPRLEVLGRVAEGEDFVVNEIRWQAFGDVHGEGLWLNSPGATKSMIVIPDADHTPEEISGYHGKLPIEYQTARKYAASGLNVFVPALINRSAGSHTLTNREYLYRPAFELGRHLIGYEIQKILALVDQLGPDLAGLHGHGEGGMLALFAAAIDERIPKVIVSGYSGPGADLWQEPAERNVFGLLKQFDRASLERMIAPRKLKNLTQPPAPKVLIEAKKSRGKPGRLLSPGDQETDPKTQAAPLKIVRVLDQEARHARQLHELDRHNQQLLIESPYVRAKFMAKLKSDSPQAFAESQKFYRDYFSEKVIGRFDDDLLPANPRTREIEINEKVRAYEVALDVFEDASFFAYGILVVPKDLKPGESRPCVVCQHGLEGRPQSTIGEKDAHYYAAFATKLAERGYVTFAPQNLYIFEDRFRTLQFKANSIGRTLFSLMVPQHQQITDWLGGLEFVDAERIGFYGLSYGGKSAMRIPPLVDNYCLSICSADFNDWVWKNASTRSPYSYANKGEYEIFEFDLGSTFNYSEMAALIAPRPFMVERGHFDGVAPDERVALEFAKVRHLYAAKLGIGERTTIEWFVGPHKINGVGTYEFLDRWLKP
jgi:cephalosporin-C deacetylase-like acetyl esterase